MLALISAMAQALALTALVGVPYGLGYYVGRYDGRARMRAQYADLMGYEDCAKQACPLCGQGPREVR